MAAETPVAANRKSAVRSTGPRTISGKTCFRMNALRHGLAASLGDQSATSDPGLISTRCPSASRTLRLNAPNRPSRSKPSCGRGNPSKTSFAEWMRSSAMPNGVPRPCGEK